MKQTHSVAVKVGKPAARAAAKHGEATLCSDCPLACQHLGALVEAETGANPRSAHPILLFAEAYGWASAG